MEDESIGGPLRSEIPNGQYGPKIFKSETNLPPAEKPPMNLDHSHRLRRTNDSGPEENGWEDAGRLE